MQSRLLLGAIFVASVAFSGWEYDSTSKLLTGDGWELTANVANGTDLTLQSLKTISPQTTILDLSTPIAGGYRIVTLSAGTALFAGRTADVISKIILPASVKTILPWAFEDTAGEITFPEDNNLAVIGDGSFYNANIPSLVLGKNGPVSLVDNDHAGSFYRSCLKDIVLCADITAVPHGMLKTCNLLTNFVSRSKSLSIASWSMQECTSLKEYSFECYPVFSSNWNYGSKTGTGVRTFFPADNVEWVNKTKESTFKLWEKCSDSERNAYFSTFGEEAEIPLGYTSSPYGTWLLPREKSLGEASRLIVKGSPEGYGLPMPGYDTHLYSKGEDFECSAPEYCAEGEYLYRCAGWRLYRFDDVDFEYVQIQSGDGTSMAYTPQPGATYMLQWQWEEAGYKVDSETCSRNPAVSVIANSSPDIQGFYSHGSTAVFSAVGENFQYWLGAPEGVDASRRTISFTVSAPVFLIPYFRNEWTFDPATSTIDNYYWRFNTSLSNGKELTLNSVNQTNRMNVVDLSLPIAGGYEITTIKESTSLFKARKATVMSEIMLPATLRKVNGWALQDCAGKISFPDGNSLTNLSQGSFMKSGLAGKLELGVRSPVYIHAADTSGVFNGTKLADIVLGRHVSAVPLGMLKSCKALTNFVSTASSLSIASWSMENCTALKEYRFACYPTLSAKWNSGAKTGTGVRTFIPVNDPQWGEIMGASTFTPWEKCSASYVSSYFSAFGNDAEVPLGYTTTPYATWLLRNCISTGTLVLIK